MNYVPPPVPQSRTNPWVADARAYVAAQLGRENAEIVFRYLDYLYEIYDEEKRAPHESGGRPPEWPATSVRQFGARVFGRSGVAVDGLSRNVVAAAVLAMGRGTDKAMVAPAFRDALVAEVAALKQRERRAK